MNLRIDSSKTTWPSFLIVNLDLVGVVIGGLLVDDKDNDFSKLERVSLSCSLLFGEGTIILVSNIIYPSVSWRIIKLRSPKRYKIIL